MRPSTRRLTPGTRRRRRGAAAFAALLLAGSIGIAGCSASSDSSNSDRAAGPAVDGARSAPDAGSVSSGKGATSDNGAVPENGAAGSAAGTPSAGGTGARAPKLAPTYLVRTADLSIRTPHVADALQHARTLAADAGGYAGDEDTAVDAQGHATSKIQLRVPPAAYDRLLDDLSGLGTLLGRKVSVQDVTGQVVDVQSRVKSQQASVDRVRRLMDQASGLSDVVSLESELSTREAALEALEAQQASLRARADLATVTLRLSEPPVKAAVHEPRKEKKDGFWTVVGHALSGGWHAFYVTLRAVLVALSAVLPFLALGVLAWVAWRLVRRWWPRTEPAAPTTLRAPGGLPRHPSPAPGRWEPPAEDPRPAPGTAPAAAPFHEPPHEEQGPPQG